MSKLSAIIIDDTPSVIEMLSILFLEYFENEVELLATYSTAKEALNGIIEYHPDVVFLDVEMPELSGFELKSLVPAAIKSKIVIISGKESYAFNAIKHSVFDFIVKPISLIELRKCINKLMEITEAKHSLQQKSIDREENLIINRQDKTVVVRIQSISRIEADGACANVFYDNKKVGSTRSFKHYETILNDNQFIKLHRSCLVNLFHIQEILKNEGEGILVLKDGTKIELSKNKKDELVKRLLTLNLI